MFETLTERLTKTFKNMVGRGKLTDSNMNETLREVKKTLLEADVAYPVIKHFLKELKEEASGIEIDKGLNPAQMLIKIVNDKLVQLMGESCVPINLKAQPPAVILMSGLHGAGKTTSSAKLAKLLKEREHKSVMMLSVDIYRPAAREQLALLAQKVDPTQLTIKYFECDEADEATLNNPMAIAKAGLEAARKQHFDVLIVDTAGRSHIDDNMMDEIRALYRLLNPIETLLVVDGMTGQDAVNTAKVFNDALALTGVIVTKLDGDSRGGAILSIRHVTGGVPIKFIGMGENAEKEAAFEPFHPARMASRMLGMGDMLSLIENLERQIDKEEAQRLEKKLKKGQGFDLEDFRNQLIQVQKMGGMMSLMDKLPGMGALPSAVKERANEKVLDKMLLILNSMTPSERRKPLILNGSRKRRITQGSGTTLAELNKLLKQHEMMQKMMGKVSRGGAANMLRGLKGKLPAGFGGLF